jgi:CRISPR system Cascade subunit CasE
MEIYLTKMNLNPRSLEVRKLLDSRNCQRLHKFVMTGFPKGNYVDEKGNNIARQKFGVLHRLEIDKNHGQVTLIVQSAKNQSVIDEQAVWNFRGDELLDDGFSQKEIGQIYSMLPNETELMFRIRANPTKRIGKNYQHPDEKVREEFDKKFKDAKKRRRISPNSEKEQIEWLINQGVRHGFELITIKVNPDNTIVSDVSTTPNGKFLGKHEKGDLAFKSVIFDGNLKITDAEKFKETLIHGIGQGKAYGFGLLSIAKSLSF